MEPLTENQFFFSLGTHERMVKSSSGIRTRIEFGIVSACALEVNYPKLSAYPILRIVNIVGARK